MDRTINVTEDRPGDRATALRKSYDREADRYDARRYKSPDGRIFSELELVVLRSWLGLKPGDKVLDIPAGTGRLAISLAQTGATMVGVDISSSMLKMAAGKEKLSSVSHLHFVQGSGAQLPFPNDMFDAVISFKFFHLIPNARKRDFILEMTRVLKPGAPLIVEFNSPFYGGVLAALRYYLRKKQPGGMRMKCLFPDQVSSLFEGLRVTRKIGVKLPFASVLSVAIGAARLQRLHLWFGSLPGAKYFAYAIIIEARKPSS